jgi:hypothetical protein
VRRVGKSNRPLGFNSPDYLTAGARAAARGCQDLESARRDSSRPLAYGIRCQLESDDGAGRDEGEATDGEEGERDDYLDQRVPGTE